MQNFSLAAHFQGGINNGHNIVEGKERKRPNIWETNEPIGLSFALGVKKYLLHAHGLMMQFYCPLGLLRVYSRKQIN